MLRDNRITVQDEIENNLAIFARTFLPGLPLVKRRLARLFQAGRRDHALSASPGSWVGGDRDGNPNVSPETLDYAVRRQAEIVLDHYLGEIHALGAELSLSDSLINTSEALARAGGRRRAGFGASGATSLTAARWSPATPAWRRPARRLLGAGPVAPGPLQGRTLCHAGGFCRRPGHHRRLAGGKWRRAIWRKGGC